MPLVTSYGEFEDHLIEDLPPELREGEESSGGSDWEGSSARWANQFLEKPETLPLLDTAVPKFERIMIDAALRKTGGCKKDAAELLGWGRNTLTRKCRSYSAEQCILSCMSRRFRKIPATLSGCVSTLVRRCI